MCGIFGFITKSGAGPDLVRLKRIAAETEMRGRHAFGLAWLSADGTIDTYKRPGPATADLGDLDQCRIATAVVGHCRWATHGDPQDNRNNHPHPAGRGWIVHNGVIANYQSLADRFHLRQATECDSEVFGLLVARMVGSLVQRAGAATRHTMGNLAVLGVWRKPARLLVVRAGNPLWFGEAREGFYFGSLSGHLPGRVTPVRDDYAGVLCYEKGELRHDAFSIAR